MLGMVGLLAVGVLTVMLGVSFIRKPPVDRWGVDGRYRYFLGPLFVVGGMFELTVFTAGLLSYFELI